MAKFGCISPSVIQLPWDLHACLPPELSANVVTLNVRNGRPGEFERAMGILKGAVDVLADEGSEAIVVFGVPVAARRGFATETREHDALSAERGGIPIISSLAASSLALMSLGVRRPLLITQYNDEVNAQILEFYRDAGLEADGAVGLGATNAAQVNKLTAQDFERLTIDALAAHPKADGVFLSARGNLATLAARLTETIGLPVLEQIKATIWWASMKIGAPFNLKMNSRPTNSIGI